MKRLKLIVATIALMGVATVAQAQEKHIGIVDIQRITSKSAAYQQIKQQADKRSEAIGKKVQKLTKELKKNFQSLEKQKSVLSEEALNKKLQELSKQESKYNKELQLERASLEKGYNNAMRVAQEKLMSIINKHAKNNNLDLVLQKDLTLYSADGLDITNKVLTSLNKELPKIEVKFDKVGQK